MWARARACAWSCCCCCWQPLPQPGPPKTMSRPVEEMAAAAVRSFRGRGEVERAAWPMEKGTMMLGGRKRGQGRRLRGDCRETIRDNAVRPRYHIVRRIERSIGQGTLPAACVVERGTREKRKAKDVDVEVALRLDKPSRKAFSRVSMRDESQASDRRPDCVAEDAKRKCKG